MSEDKQQWKESDRQKLNIPLAATREIVSPLLIDRKAVTL